MAPKRSKKAPKKKQTKLNFRRKPKKEDTIPPLIQVLSQYELMLMVTDHLSSADLVHLIATCKEIETYITGDKTIYSRIQENAICDGKGIEARARCFGHWKGDISQAKTECQAELCVPCEDCEAMVCNNCRFHITYLDGMSCCKSDPAHWEYHETEYAELVDMIRRCHHDHCDDCPDFHSGNYPIEAIRAAHLAGEPRERRFCTDCRPTFAGPDLPDEADFEEVLDFVYDIEMADDWCMCSLTTHFIEERWLCIPCFFKREAEAYGRLTQKRSYRLKIDENGDRIKEGKTEKLCDCGKVANIPFLTECRWCEEFIRTPCVADFLDDI